MISSSSDSREGFAYGPVPLEATGSASRIFFIVVGTLCGLPAFVLACRVAAAFGVRAATYVFLTGGAISAALGAFSAYTGARTRLSLALLAQATFGTRGAKMVQLAIAFSSIGWFAVILSVLAEAIRSAIAGVEGVWVPTAVIALPLCVLITLVATKGAGWMQKLGTLIVPLTFILLAVSVFLTRHSNVGAALRAPSGALDFSSAVAAVVGSYIVGIIIQPDYARFVRRPGSAAFAEILALGVAYPLILSVSALPAAALAKPDLIAALMALGLGLPALVLLVLGAWIDASSCLYSGSLALAVLFPRLRLAGIIIGAATVSGLLALAHEERHFLSFLQVLGVSLPPLAAVQCTTALLTSAARRVANPRINTAAFVQWAVGVAAGFVSQHSSWTVTGLAVLDSVLFSVVATVIWQGGVSLLSKNNPELS